METSIISVGIDIGTTTTSMMVSRLFFSNTTQAYMVPDIKLYKKEILYKSKIYLTPLKDRQILDGMKIREIIEAEYEKAQIFPPMVKTGAVIITGESAMKENADTVLAELSDFAGEFVVATAGPDLEAVIAGRGAGAEDYSREHNCTVANLDIGGGTTNIAVFDNGDLSAQTCIDIGGRLLQYKKDGTIDYVSERLNKLLASALGHGVQTDWSVTKETLSLVTDVMAETIADALEGNNQLVSQLLTANSRCLPPGLAVTRLFLSGGVADCYFQREQDTFKYGDLGVSLAQSLEKNRRLKKYHVLKPRETIRATVVGAGVHTTEVSGSTISYSKDLFPIKNIKVFNVSQEAETDILRGEAERFQQELHYFQVQNHDNAKTILCFQGKRRINYEELNCMAELMANLADSKPYRDQPLLILVKNDMAKALGQTIKRKLAKEHDLVCLDKVDVAQGDYVDIGKPLMQGMVIPVVIKTLIYR